jgi:hypothetical protein
MLVVASAILAIGFGFCVLPGHHGDGGTHGHSPELCAGLVVVLLTITPLVKPTLNGWFVAIPQGVVPPIVITLLELPPELAIGV